MMNEAAMALRGIIVNTQNKVNPLKHWNHAVWFYQWIPTEFNMAHCVLLAFISIVQRTVPLAKPDIFKWIKLEETMNSTLSYAPEMGHITRLTHIMESILSQIVGESIFAKDASPSPPAQKRTKAHGEFQETINDIVE